MLILDYVKIRKPTTKKHPLASFCEQHYHTILHRHTDVPDVYNQNAPVWLPFKWKTSDVAKAALKIRILAAYLRNT